MASKAIATPAPAPVADVVLVCSKATKGTYVFANDEANLNIYVPKPYLLGKIDAAKPEGTKLRLQLSLVP